MSITLFIEPTGSLSKDFDDSNADLKAEATFKKAVVTTGTWIFYTYANYNNAQVGGSSNNYKVLKEGDEEDITSVNGSMYLVQNATEGVILFQHVYYGGPRRYVSDHCPDVNEGFPNLGVSSAINLSHDERFLIYTETDYQGLEAPLEINKWYPTPSDMGFPNDSLRSIRKG